MSEVKIKARYYDRDGQSMTAKFTHPGIPRRGESINLGPEGERQSYCVHDVRHFPHEPEWNVFIVCRTDRPAPRR